MYNKAHRLKVKKIVVKSKSNSDIADMQEKGDIALCDGTSAIQKVYLPEETETYGQTVRVRVSNATNNTLVYAQDGSTPLFTLSTAGSYDYFNDAGTWIEV